jgi:hypothetical protein
VPVSFFGISGRPSRPSRQDQSAATDLTILEVAFDVANHVGQNRMVTMIVVMIGHTVMVVVVHHFGGSGDNERKSDGCRKGDFGDHRDSGLRRRNPKVGFSVDD